MRLCGEEVTEKELFDKTFSTFHSTNVLLQQQYRERGFASYTDPISCLLLSETNNELLMKNSEMRPIRTSALPEANEAEKKDPKECNQINMKSHGKGRSRFKGRGCDSYGRQGNHNNRGRGSSRGRGNYGRGRGGISKPSYSRKSACHKCGMENHWAKNCGTYVSSIKRALRTRTRKPIWFMIPGMTLIMIPTLKGTTPWILRLLIVSKTKIDILSYCFMNCFNFITIISCLSLFDNVNDSIDKELPKGHKIK